MHPNSGINNVAEYIASGSPFALEVAATTTPTKVEFPTVASELTLVSSADAYIGYSENGVNGVNRILLPANVPVTLRVRVIDIFVRGASGSANVTISAGLTSIARRLYPNLSGIAGIG